MEDIAIVAVAGRFGPAPDPESLWSAIASRRELVVDYGASELEAAGVAPADLASDDYVARGSFIADAEMFDAGFFGMTPRETVRVDPQQRLFLEACHQVLERAGYGPGTFEGDIGVYAASHPSSWVQRLATLPEGNVGDHYTALGGNWADAVATRIAYKLGCTGPAFTVETGDSGSLVAVHLACQALLDGECDLALAGGVTIRFPQRVGYRVESGDGRSRQGRCRAFDAAADGSVSADAVGVVALRRLDDAQRDGDVVLAVVRGSAMGNVGAARQDPAGLARVVAHAMRRAGVQADEVSLVEASGVGTRDGDGLEVRGLVEAFGTERRGYCGLGSVTSNLGHAGCASGVVGLIKTVLALQAGVLPPTLHFDAPNPECDLFDSPFWIVDESAPWSGRRIAGVNALGAEGTHAHVVVEAAPPAGPRASSQTTVHVLPLSARSQPALVALAEALRNHLLAHPDEALADVAFTLQRGRQVHAHRRAIVARTPAEAIAQLAVADPPMPEDHGPEHQLARAWCEQQTNSWDGLYVGEARRRVCLPTYPFERVLIAPPVQQAPVPPPVEKVPVRPDILHQVIALFARALQMEPADVEPTVPLLEIGADSLLLIGVLEPLQEQFGLRVSMRQFFVDLPTIEKVAEYVARNSPMLDARSLDGGESSGAAVAPVVVAAPEPSVPVAAPAVAATPAVAAAPAVAVESVAGAAAASGSMLSVGGPSADVQDLVRQQLRIMEQQLELLRGAPSRAVPAAAVAAPAVPAATPPPVVTPEPPAAKKGPTAMPIPGQSARPAVVENDARRRYVARFSEAYIQRTKGSRDHAARFREKIADSRSSIGFRSSLKELHYPIVCDEASGAHIRDIDGNDYVDMTMGYGVQLLGHNPARVAQALRERQEAGFQLGLRSELALPVADLILEMTGMDRVAFVNSGTEAVINAMRVARAATNKDRIVLFTTSYHGHSDGVLAVPALRDGQPGARPMAVGVPESAVGDIVVLQPQTDAAIEYIAAHADTLAAVMIEPVPTRRPAMSDPTFLRQLREVTQQHGVLLIFDEMVTGFRSHPGGVQGLFGIEADLATYGKIAGGGLPMGVVAGRAGVLDSIDGGPWYYGDDSYPAAESTFFGGTFFQHPLVMTAAHAALTEIRDRSPQLQADLTERAARFAAELNAWFASAGVSIEIQQFSSFFRMVHQENLDLLYYSLLARGVYIWEWRCWFLSDAHTDADLAFVRDAMIASVEELCAEGLIRVHGKVVTPAATTSAAPPVEPRELPMATAQRQIWAQSKALAEASLAYKLYAGVEVSGEVDQGILATIIDDLVARRMALRSVPSASGEVLRIRPATDAVDFEVIRCATPEDRQRGLEAEAVAPFDLDRGPLFRARLFRGEGSSLLLIAVHHIVVDGAAVGTLMEELCAAYGARSRGEAMAPHTVDPLEALVAWRDGAPMRDAWKHGKQHWERELGSLPACARLPGARDARSFAVVRSTSELPAEELRAMRADAARIGVSPFVVCTAAVNLLLHRLSGQAELVVGAPVARRPAGAASRAVGYSSDLVVLRSKVDATLSLEDYLTGLRDDVLQGLEHHGFDYAQAFELGMVDRPDALSSMVTLERVADTIELGDLVARPMAPMPIRYGPFGNEVNVVEDARGLTLTIDLQHTAMSPRLAQRFGDDLLTVLRSIATALAQGAQAPAITLPIVTPQQAASLLAIGRGPDVVPGPGTLIERVIAQTLRVPERPAVHCEDRTLSYGEVGQLSRNVAAALRSRTLGGRDRIIAIRMPRSERTPLAVLGVWRAGAAYVPLDLAHPAERHLQIIEDSGAIAVIGQGAPPPELADVPWLDLDELCAFGETSPEREALPADDALAYLMYSSGSTGKPKGIQLECEGMLNHVLAKIEDYEITADSVLAQNAPLGFDISVWQLVAPLLVGGAVRVYGDDAVRDPARFVRELDRDGVTQLELVPSYLGMLLDEVEQSGTAPKLAALRYAILQAEPLPPRHVERWQRAFAGCKISNAYGATETSDDVFHLVLDTVDTDSTPTGKPIRNARVYIVDPWDNLCPVGVPGELCVGGIAVGRGYVGAVAGRNAFSPRDPFCDEGGRFYRTGDRAVCNGDGTYFILGRNDGQLKVRGQRVELGEVEKAVQALEFVSAGAVKAFPDPTESNILCAYVVPATVRCTPAWVSEQLGARLPEYMIPRHVVLMDALPINANGKVDRHALLEPSASVSPQPEPVRIRHAHDERILAIASKLLRREAQLDAGFFEQGGSSIAAVRFAQMIRKELGVEFPLPKLYELETLAAVSDAIGDSVYDVDAEIPRVEDLPHHRVSASAQRMHFLWTYEPDSPVYNIPIVYELEGTVDRTRLERALQLVVHKHEIFRSGFHVVGDQVVHSIIDDVHVPLEDLAPTDESVDEILARWVRPYDLRRPPLFRAALLPRGEGRSLLLLDMHHITFDEGSAHLLLDDLGRAYTTGRLEPATARYRDFAEWEHGYQCTARYREHLDYWLDKLDALPDDLPYPRVPRPAIWDFEGARKILPLGSELTAGVRALCKKANASQYMVLLAAFKLLLSRYGGSRDIVVGTPADGRYHHGCGEIIGMFGNSLPLRTQLHDDATFADYLVQVRRVTLEALEHQAVPFEEMVRRLNLPRATNRNPIYQFMFVFTDLDRYVLELGELRARWLPASTAVARMDMSLSAYESEDEIGLAFEYASSLFTEQDVDGIAKHLRHILSQVLARPDTRLGDVTLEEPAAVQRLLRQGTASGSAPPFATAREVIWAECDRSGDRTALVTGDVRWTYDELRRRARAIAGAIAQAEIRDPDAIVGIMAHDPAEQIAGIVGAHAAGVAYVLLDPLAPLARLQQVARLAEIPLLLRGAGVDPAAMELAPVTTSIPTVWDADVADVAEHSTGQTLAYVIFTSGSSGTPRGVMVEHDALVRGFCRPQWLNTDEPMVVAQTASPYFDAALGNIYSALLNGATLVWPTREQMLDPAAFEALMMRERATMSLVPTAIFHTLAATRPSCFDSFTQLLVGGERIRPDLAEVVAKRGAPGRFCNGYGPTEVNVISTCEVIGPRTEGGDLPIGGPVDHTRLYVLDAAGQPCPEGMVGELYIGGERIARGYLGEQDVDDPFISDPFVPGERCYRTGDLVRWLPGGTLGFVGRCDSEVKIRGYRVNPGEVEHVLNALDAVREGAVVTHTHGPQTGAELVAFVVLAPGATLQAVRTAMTDTLPQHLVPTRFRALDALPKNAAGGKVDRRALGQARLGPEASAGPAGARPLTSTERRLAEIWCEVLGVSAVRSEDDFYGLGGHSLAAVIVRARIEESLDADVPLVALLSSPTLEALAQQVDARLGSTTRQAGE